MNEINTATYKEMEYTKQDLKYCFNNLKTHNEFKKKKKMRLLHLKT